MSTESIIQLPKLVECPRCYKQIDHLFQTCNIDQTHKVKLSDDNTLVWELDDEYFGDSSGFECPECDQVLCTDTAEAIAFLSHKQVSQEA